MRSKVQFLVGLKGREHEWVFGSAEGQRQLAAQCGSRRVMIVSLGRGHTFPALPTLQVRLLLINATTTIRHLYMHDPLENHSDPNLDASRAERPISAA